jgi:hypothetical protein
MGQTLGVDEKIQGSLRTDGSIYADISDFYCYSCGYFHSVEFYQV